MARKRWTPEEVRALGVVTDLRTAFSVTGMGASTGYAAAKKGELPFAVLTLGRKYVVPVAGLLAALGIEDTAAAA